jgi:hypothetical protein
MPSYEHAVTLLSKDEVLARLSRATADAAPPVLYCGAERECFFDDAPNPYVSAIVEALDAKGAEGWALVQVVPRQSDMICFWRRQLHED